MAADSDRIHTFFVLKEAGQPSRVIVWDTQEISLGRSSENDLAFDHAEVSRKHAQFVRTGKSCVVQNLSTANGTLVNGEAVATRALEARDEIRIADVELVFYQSAKDPVALGMKIDYASQLKQFPGPSLTSANAEATMLGLLDTPTGDDAGFEVKPAGEFAYDLHGMDEFPGAPSTPRDLDLDLELDGFGLDDLDIPDKELPLPVEPAAAKPNSPAAVEPTRKASPESEASPVPEPQVSETPEVWELEDLAGAPNALSLQLEIEGLQGELRRVLQGLIGKTVDLPAMRIRIKGDDLG